MSPRRDPRRDPRRRAEASSCHRRTNYHHFPLDNGRPPKSRRPPRSRWTTTAEALAEQATSWHIDENTWMVESGRRSRIDIECDRRRKNKEYSDALDAMAATRRRCSDLDAFGSFASAAMATLVWRAKELQHTHRVLCNWKHQRRLQSFLDRVADVAFGRQTCRVGRVANGYSRARADARTRGARRALARGANAPARRGQEARRLLRRRHVLVEPPRLPVHPEEEVTQADGGTRAHLSPRRIQDLEVLPLRARRPEGRLVAPWGTRARARPCPQDMRGRLRCSSAMSGSRRSSDAEHATGGRGRRAAPRLARASTTTWTSMRTSSF